MEPTGFPDLIRERTRLLALMRAAAGIACVVAQFRSPLSARGPALWVSVLFAAYALAGLSFRGTLRPLLGLLTLVGETVYFLFYAAFSGDSAPWVTAGLYFYVLLSALLARPWWDVWVVVVVCALFVAGVPALREGPLLQAVAWSGLVACFGAYYHSKLIGRLEDAAAHSREQAELAGRVRDADRQKLAGDFHDGPLQVFIALQMRLEVVGRLLERNAGAAAEELRELQEMSKSQIADMRAFLRGIRPVKLGEGGLTASLRGIAADFQKRTGVTVTFQSGDSVDSPSVEVSEETIQIVREALNNVQKHAKATRVAIALRRTSQGIEVAVEDNGAGFPFSGCFDLHEQELLHIGPFSIQKRVRGLKGELVVESRPQRGAAIRARIPA